MKNSFINSKLIEKNVIRIMIFSSTPWEELKPVLLIDNAFKEDLFLLKSSSMGGVYIIDYKTSHYLELGHSYKILTSRYGITPLNISNYTEFEGFEEDFYYDGDDLGATYSNNGTMFVLWAPLASKVFLKYRNVNDCSYKIEEMIREDKGIYRLFVKGNLNNFLYKFLIINNETEIEVTDPYAKGSTLNGKESVVIDFSEFNLTFDKKNLVKYESYNDLVIYETNVRDFTISTASDILNKGFFKGMCEENRKTSDGLHAGFDYLKDLGITHVQLMPINDFKTVDETNIKNSYNWGYDPAQFFVPEGSYGSSENPLSRINDFKHLVHTYNEAGIGIIIDVVFNHVYEWQDSVFEKVVPNYYFRKKDNGILSSCSGCGNDFASEKLMVRKLIVDACKFWIKEYHVDGFRFDLMGILDTVTINAIKDMARSINPAFILYGEGWNMGCQCKYPLSTIENHSLTPDFGFFNDFFRDSVRRYFTGDYRTINDVKASFFGNCIPNFIRDARFSKACDSINYCECHDNATLFDYVNNTNRDRPLNETLDLVDAITSTILFSVGIPLIHMGQEIGQSKWDDTNTYNKGDFYNKFSYRLLKERFNHFELVKNAIKIRKQMRFAHLIDPNEIASSFEVTDFDNIIEFVYKDENDLYYIYLNPTNNCKEIPIDFDYECVFCSSGSPEHKKKCIIIKERSFSIYKLFKEKE